MKKYWSAAGIVLALVLSCGAARAADMLVIESKSGDPVGGGVYQSHAIGYTFAVGSVGVDAYGTVDGGAAGIRWTWSFTAGGPALAVGSYENAVVPASIPGPPTLNISRNGSYCSTGTGRFQVLDILRNGAGQILSLAIDFEQRCTGYSAPLYGQLRIGSGVPVVLGRRHVDAFTLPTFSREAVNSAINSFPVTLAGIDIGVPIQVSAGTYSLNGSPFTSSPGTAFNGDVLRVQVISAPVPNQARSATIDVGGFQSTFRVATDPGLTPQPGGESLYVVRWPQWDTTRPDNVAVYSSGTFFRFDAGTLAPVYALDMVPLPGNTRFGAQLGFAGPNETNLVPGTYVGATLSSPYVNGRLYTTVAGCVNDYARPSRMLVHEVSYLPTGALERLALDYDYACLQYSGAAHEYGYVRYNSTVPIDYTRTSVTPFAIAPVFAAAPGSLVVSAPVVVGGFNVPVAISIAGGEYSIDGGPFTAAAGTVTAGQAVRVRVSASGQPNTFVTATLTVGDTSAVFKVGSDPGPMPQPDGSPLVVSVLNPSYAGNPIQRDVFSVATGNPIRLSSDFIGQALPATSVHVSYDGYANQDRWRGYFGGDALGPLLPGTYTNFSYNPQAGQALMNFGCSVPDGISGDLSTVLPKMVVYEVHYLPDGTPDQLAMDLVRPCGAGPNVDVMYAYVRVNSNMPIDYAIRLPTPFAFPAVGSLQPGQNAISVEQLIRGITVDVPITITGGEYSIDGGPFTSAAGTISPNQRLRLRATAPAQLTAIQTATVTVGERSGSFSVGTVSADYPQPTGTPLVVLIGHNYPQGTSSKRVFSPSVPSDIRLRRSGMNDQRTLSVGAYEEYTGFTAEKWSVGFAVSGQSNIQPGTYSATGNYNNLSAPFFYTLANLDDTPDCIYWDTSTARVTVYDVAYDATGVPTRLAMDFEQVCDPRYSTGYVAAVFGFIRINSSLPIDYSIRRPVPFSFASVTGAAPNSIVESGEATINGIAVPVPITVTGAEYSIDGGAYVAVPGTVQQGQKVRLRVTAPASYNALAVAQVTIGEGSAEFRVGTATGIAPQPNGSPLAIFISQGAFTIGEGRTYVFSPATLATFAVTINGDGSGPSVVINTPSTQYPGSFITWYANFAAADNAHVTSGTTYANAHSWPRVAGQPAMSVIGTGGGNCYTRSGQFTVHEAVYSETGIDALAVDFVQYCSNTPEPLYGYIRINSNVPIVQIVDVLAAPFFFPDRLNAAPGSLQISEPVVMGGFNTATNISIANGEYSIDGGAFTATPSTIQPGQLVRVRVSAPTAYYASKTASLTVGGFTGTFYVRVQTLDTMPDSPSFGYRISVPRNVWVYSNVVTLTGFNVAVGINVYGGEYSIGGQPFTTQSSLVYPGDTVQLRVMSASGYSQYREVSVWVGDSGGVFYTTTLGRATLSVDVSGSGTVLSSPAGLQCPPACSADFDQGTAVTLTAVPGTGLSFNGWSGACSGTAPCTLTLNANAAVSAAFDARPPGAPTIVSAIAGDSTIAIHFLPPAANGGAAINQYTATCLPGSVTVTGNGSPLLVTGLVNGTPYTCSVSASNAIGTGPASSAVVVTPSALSPFALVAVESRKVHGGAGTFNLPVDFTAADSGTVTIEPRAAGSGHLLVFRFTAAVASYGAVSVTAGASVLPGAIATVAGNELQVLLPAIADRQRVRVSIAQVNGSLDVSAALGLLLGDVNASGAVGPADASAVRAGSGQAADTGNYRLDVNVSGAIGAADVMAVKRRSGNMLP